MEILYLGSMMHFHDALSAVKTAAQALPIVQIAVASAAHRVLAADIYAPIAHPLFDQSAVDGYALRFADLATGNPLQVADQVRAGDAGERTLAQGECSRIFTGAPLPPGADTIVMQELVAREGDHVRVLDTGLRLGGNVRPAGEQIRAGALALGKGDVLNAAAIGFLASLGIQTVPVHALPRVQIIVTGDEFATADTDLQRGKIYESNGQMLCAALSSLGLQATFECCKDDATTLAAHVARAAADCDLLILTGGVSVGDFDFSRGALEAGGFDVIFHQVAQKPGKPLLFARKGPQFAFGLPGNPRAVLMCFYLYVLPLLDGLQGKSRLGLRQVRLPFQQAFRRKSDGKTHFLTGRLESEGFTVLGGQASHMLQSFAQADVVVVNEDHETDAAAGHMATCFLLP